MDRINLYITNPILETFILLCHIPGLFHTILEYSKHFYFYKNTIDISTQAFFFFFITIFLHKLRLL